MNKVTGVDAEKIRALRDIKETNALLLEELAGFKNKMYSLHQMVTITFLLFVFPIFLGLLVTAVVFLIGFTLG